MLPRAERVRAKFVAQATRLLSSLMLLFLLLGTAGCNQRKAAPTYENDFLTLATSLDKELENLEQSEVLEKIGGPRDQQQTDKPQKSNPADYEPMDNISTQRLLQRIKESTFKKDWESQRSKESYKKLCATLDKIHRDFTGLKSNAQIKRAAAVEEARVDLLDAMIVLRTEEGGGVPANQNDRNAAEKRAPAGR